LGEKQNNTPPKSVPRYLIPGRGKHGAPGLGKPHVALLCASIDDEWRLFSEGCLRNGYFRKQVLKRSPKCMACNRKLDDRSALNNTKTIIDGPVAAPYSQKIPRMYIDHPDRTNFHRCLIAARAISTTRTISPGVSNGFIRCMPHAMNASMTMNAASSKSKRPTNCVSA